MVLWLDVLSLVDEPSPQLMVYDHGPSLSGSLNVACSVQSRPTSAVASDPALTVGGWLGWLTVTLCDVVPVAPWLSVTVRVTEYVPPAAYVCDEFCAVDVAPSPNVQL